MKGKKKEFTGLILSLFVAGLIVGGIYLYNSNEKSKTENAIEKAQQEYYKYLAENDKNSEAENVNLIYEYYNNNEHENKDVNFEIKKLLRKDLRESVEYLVNSGSTTKQELLDIGHIIDEDFVSEETRVEYDESMELFNRYDEMVSKMSDSEFETLDEHVKTKTKIKIGMSNQDVINRLGKPNNSVTSNSSNGVLKILYYDDKIVYLKNDVVYKTVDF